MDEVRIGEIKTLYGQFQELEKRKTTVLDSIREQEKLTPELEKQIREAMELRVLEDLYLPYKPRKLTRASKAKAKGLEPLAKWMLQQNCGDPVVEAGRFVNKEVKDGEEALQGARDILAEWISESEVARNKIRKCIEKEACICSRVVKGKEEEGGKYADYFDYRETLKYCPSHRMLAIRRGEAEGILRVGLEIDDEQALDRLEHIFVKG